MTHWKIKHTAITYAGREILAPGSRLEDTELILAKNYNAEATPTVTRRALIHTTGNPTGELTFTTIADYHDKNSAIAAQIELQTWADTHQTGQLTIAAVPADASAPSASLIAYSAPAALVSITTRLTLAPRAIRLITDWNFIF